MSDITLFFIFNSLVMSAIGFAVYFIFFGYNDLKKKFSKKQ